MAGKMEDDPDLPQAPTMTAYGVDAAAMKRGYLTDVEPVQRATFDSMFNPQPQRGGFLGPLNPYFDR